MKSIIFLLFLLALLLAITACKEQSLEERREKVLSELSLAIEEAEKAGVYKCCIKPACTMCYIGANKWNYGKAGTCYCDDFIARGEEPCPQCKKGIEEGLCESTAEEPCDINSGDNFRPAELET